MNVHERLGLIKSKGLSIKRLAQIVDRHPSYVSVVLANRYYSPTLRKKIAETLGVSESEFWGDTGKQ